MRWPPARGRSHGRKWNALHWQHYRDATCYAPERHGQPTGAGWANCMVFHGEKSRPGIQVQEVGP